MSISLFDALVFALFAIFVLLAGLDRLGVKLPDPLGFFARHAGKAAAFVAGLLVGKKIDDSTEPDQPNESDPKPADNETQGVSYEDSIEEILDDHAEPSPGSGDGVDFSSDDPADWRF